MNALKKHLQHSPLGQRLYHKATRALIAVKPFHKQSAVSDLFVWRCDKDWDTFFEFMNISSYVYPTQNPKEVCVLKLYGDDGQILGTKEYALEPFEMKTVNLRELLPSNGHYTQGTFAIFHHCTNVGEFIKESAHLCERGYVSYKQTSGTIKSYCHGNLVALSQSNPSAKISFTTVRSEDYVYSPQVDLSDAKQIELVYTNPSKKVKDITVKAFDAKGELVEEQKRTIQPLGVSTIQLQNEDGSISTINNTGNIAMWRPLFFKYYDTHFDVFHG